MPVLKILVGPPGSGKSTYAKSLDMKYINQDEQGPTMHMELFLEAVRAGDNIVVDRMNFSREQRARYIEPARAAGYTVHIETFYTPSDICISRCLAREDHPTLKREMGPKILEVVAFFHRKFERPTADEADLFTIHQWKHEHLPKQDAIICDLDGTLCNIDHRLKYARGPEKDWIRFMQEISNDSVNNWCARILRAMEDVVELIYCSGRSDEYRQTTIDWLEKEGLWELSHTLHMRRAGDYRKDSLIKENILDFEILPRYNVVCCIDDRKQVIDMYRNRGLVVLDCSGKDF